MARKKIKNQENKKDDLNPNSDQFIDKTTTVFDWAFERRRPIGVLLAMALVGSIAGIGLDYLLESRQSEASEVVGKGLQAAVAPVIEDRDDIPSGEEEDILTFDTPKARATEALKRFEEASSKTGASLAQISVLGAAAAHYDLGEYDKAIAKYETFLSETGGQLSWLRPGAIEGLCYALEAAGKVDDARKRLDDLIAKSSGAAAKMAKYQAARLALLKDDRETATRLLREVVDSYADTEKLSKLDFVFVQARERILTLDSDAEVPDLPAGGMGGLEGVDPRILQQLMQAQQGGGAS